MLTSTLPVGTSGEQGLLGLALDPNFAQAYGSLANQLDFAGEHERAIGLAEQAIQLDPQFDLWIQTCGRAQFALECCRVGRISADLQQLLLSVSVPR